MQIQISVTFHWRRNQIQPGFFSSHRENHDESVDRKMGVQIVNLQENLTAAVEGEALGEGLFEDTHVY